MTLENNFFKFIFSKGANISNFYGTDSLLTFESEKYYGVNNIMNKLNQINLNCNYTNYEIQPKVLEEF